MIPVGLRGYPEERPGGKQFGTEGKVSLRKRFISGMDDSSNFTEMQTAKGAEEAGQTKKKGSNKSKGKGKQVMGETDEK